MPKLGIGLRGGRSSEIGDCKGEEIVPFGISRDMRLEVPTDKPASCRERIRSAILPPSF